MFSLNCIEGNFLKFSLSQFFQFLIFPFTFVLLTDFTCSNGFTGCTGFIRTNLESYCRYQLFLVSFFWLLYLTTFFYVALAFLKPDFNFSSDNLYFLWRQKLLWLSRTIFMQLMLHPEIYGSCGISKLMLSNIDV